MEWVKEILFATWEHLNPFIVIKKYELGVKLRLGVNPIELKPGLHWRWWLIDKVFTCVVSNDTLSAKPVHVTTLDEKTITVTPVIEFVITDAILYIINTNEAYTNLHDITRSVAADYLTDINWHDAKKKTTTTHIKTQINKRVCEMGVLVTRVSFSDVCISRIIITAI